MRISIKNILGKEVGSKYQEYFEEEFPHLFEEDDMKLCTPIKGHVEIIKAGHAFLVEVNELSLELEMACDRCTKLFRYPIENAHTSVREYYVKKPEEYLDEVNEDVFRVDLTFRALEMDEMLRQEIVVLLPVMHLCKEDCAGLLDDRKTGVIYPFEELQNMLDI